VPDLLSKNQITTYRKLTQRKYREMSGLYLAEGLRTVSQLLLSDTVLVESVILQDGTAYTGPMKPGVKLFTTDRQMFTSLSDTEQSQGIVAVCQMNQDADITALTQLGSGVVLALDGLQDPGNMGTIIRTAAWFGVQGLLMGSGTVDYYNPKVVRSTAGGLEVVPHASCILTDVLPQFTASGWQVVVLDMGEDAVSMQRWNPADKVVLVVGNEGAGISEAVRSLGLMSLFIQGQHDQVESLNAGVAASIALFRVLQGR
jgi:TrmH family RNA methyltransferase